ncbi:MAG: DUF1003 domain-containing protein [Deltaproteobacteria bacterium]|nr:DUF1003 domain-containing protein [Deltaproteobacteria bacterium]
MTSLRCGRRLFLSTLAALQPPIIMMSQNRASARDRRKGDEDYKVNLKAELEIEGLHDKIDHLLHVQWDSRPSGSGRRGGFGRSFLVAGGDAVSLWTAGGRGRPGGLNVRFTCGLDFNLSNTDWASRVGAAPDRHPCEG